ncbi:MAG: STN domain-containing protein [Saprospiraceae bacterium]|nr:STN domain-containing protein [Lewinella sp.]
MKYSGNLLFTSFILLGSLSLTGQSNVLDKIVSLHYTNEPLGNVLTGISVDYDVRFAYSSDIVPVSHRVNVEIEDESLDYALDELFSETKVEHKVIGSHIILKVNQNKLSRLNTPLPKNVPQISPIYPERKPVEEMITQRRPPRERISQPEDLGQREYRMISGGDSVYELDDEYYELKEVKYDPNRSVSQQRLAQISLLSFLGTNMERSDDLTNHLSVNVLWGKNGGVKGLEVGGLVNAVVNDVEGVQVAGLSNTVGGKVIGTQVSGLFNTAGKEVDGIQAAGLFNVSGEMTRAVQTAGLFNVSSGDFYGLQVGGLFNVSNGKADGAQFSGLFNTANGKVKSQMSGLFNAAGDVQWGQVSTLLNVGKNVKGFQIGLINVSDTISGIPLGLINIVRHGYNKVEFAGSETLFANFSLKLGARSFYNIFHAGIRWDDREISENGTTHTGRFNSWGLGYGIGTVIGMGRYSLINFELEAIHINELESWTDELNLLNQARLTYAVKTGPRGISLFAGPVFNLMISRLYDPDTGTYGSSITPETFYDETTNGTNIKMWTGFTAGIRF